MATQRCKEHLGISPAKQRWYPAGGSCGWIGNGDGLFTSFVIGDDDDDDYDYDYDYDDDDDDDYDDYDEYDYEHDNDAADDA